MVYLWAQQKINAKCDNIQSHHKNNMALQNDIASSALTDENHSKQPCQDSETSLDWSYGRDNSATTRRSSSVLSHALQKIKRDSIRCASTDRMEEVTFVLRKLTNVPKKNRSVETISASITEVTTKSDVKLEILQESTKSVLNLESQYELEDVSICHTISDDHTCAKNDPHRTPKSQRRYVSPKEAARCASPRRNFSTDSLAFMRNILLQSQEKYEHDKSEQYWKQVQQDEISVSRSPKRNPPSRSKSDDNALYKRKESSTFVGTRSQEKLTKQLYDDLRKALALDQTLVRSNDERLALVALRESIRSPVRVQRKKSNGLVCASFTSTINKDLRCRSDHNASISSMSKGKESDHSYSLLNNSCHNISNHILLTAASELKQQLNHQNSNSSFSQADNNSKSSLAMSSFCSYSSTHSVTVLVRERTISIEVRPPLTITGSVSEKQKLSSSPSEVFQDSVQSFIPPSADTDVEVTPLPYRKDHTNISKARGRHGTWVANLLDKYLEGDHSPTKTEESPFPSSDDSCYTDATPVSNQGRSRMSNLTVRKFVNLISPKSPMMRDKKRMPYRIPIDMFPKGNRFVESDDDDDDEISQIIVDDDDSALEGTHSITRDRKVKGNKKKIPSILKSISKRYFRR
jgi:hypothetical protein